MDYSYDHAGRLTKVEQEVTGDTGNGKVTLAELEYNEIGQPVEKYLHGGSAQSVDYRYNIRGWLTSINNSSLSNDGTLNDDTSDKFGMELNYNNYISGVNSSGDELYSGYITSMLWKTYGNNKQAYGYSYDELGQIKEADYKEYVSSTWTDQSGAYDLSSITYDLNGNITSLLRKDGSGNDLYNFSYIYSTSNQISSLTDNETSTAYSNYSYDNNGNMTEDKLRGFSTEYYPTLNLVNTVAKGSDEVTYIYDAVGNKLKKSSSSSSIYYAGIFVYDNNMALDYIINKYGSVTYNGSAYSYQYYLTDHLGNIRVVVNSSGTVQQTNDYYPFGLVFSLNNLDKNTYLFGAKEYQNFTLDGTSEEFFDFGFRVFDPVLGRWSVPDPVYQYSDVSPYGYCLNNPINLIDNHGLSSEDPDYWDAMRAWITGKTNKAPNPFEKEDHEYENKKNLFSLTHFGGKLVNHDKEQSNSYNNIGIVEERLIQFSLFFGGGGPTGGVSIVKLPIGEYVVFYNSGTSIGVDLPNIDIGKKYHIALNPQIDWIEVLSGWSGEIGVSVTVLGLAVGGDQQSNSNFDKMAVNYFSISEMVNIGFDDFWARGHYSIVNQKKWFKLPKWLNIF